MVDFVNKMAKARFMKAVKEVNKLEDEFIVADPKGKSKYLDFFLEIVPTIYSPTAKGKHCATVICLCCLFDPEKPKSMQHKAMRYLESGYIQGHIRDSHPKCYKNVKNEQSWYRGQVLTILKSKRFPGKLDVPALIKRDSKKHSKRAKLGFRNYDELKYLEALWTMRCARPTVIVEDDGYRAVKMFLDLNTRQNSFSRWQIGRAQKIIYGFTLFKLRERIQESAEYFAHRCFISIQADSWTSQANFNVYGISITFFDVKLMKPVTCVLYCAPLKQGKAHEKLNQIVNNVLDHMQIPKLSIIQSISDAEACVKKSFVQSFPHAPHYISVMSYRHC